MYEIESTHWWFRSLHELVLGHIDKNHNKTINILDAGCGTGCLLLQMKNLGKITGIDFRDAALSYCRRRGLKNTILVDLNKWNEIENQFDYVISLDVISDQGIDDDKLILEKFYKSLKPGGKLLLHVPAFPILKRRHDETVTIRNRYRRKDIEIISKEVGFTPVQIQYRLFFAFPLFLIWKLFESIISRRKKTESDLFTLPSFANCLLIQLSRWENTILRYGISLPWGTSIFSILQKKL
jgi:SAM-dependent methyltransferase